MLKILETGLGALVRASALMGVLTLLALMGLIVVTVIFRAIGIAFPGTYVLSELLLIPTITLSLAYAAWDGAHTKVDLLTQTLPTRLADWLEGLMLLLGCGFWGFVLWSAIHDAQRHAAQGEKTPLLDIPVAPFRWLIVGATALLIAVLVLRALQRFAPGAERPRDPHAPDPQESVE